MLSVISYPGEHVSVSMPSFSGRAGQDSQHSFRRPGNKTECGEHPMDLLSTLSHKKSTTVAFEGRAANESECLAFMDDGLSFLKVAIRCSSATTETAQGPSRKRRSGYVFLC